MTDELTPVEKDSLRWVIFLEKYDAFRNDPQKNLSYADFYAVVTRLVENLR